MGEHSLGVHSKRMPNKQGCCRQLQKYVRIQDYCWSVGKATMYRGNLTRTFLHGPVKWKVMQRNAWKDIANWQTKHLNSYTKSQHHALTTTNSRMKKWDLFENCQKFLPQNVLKCLYLARIGKLDISWSVNKFARAITRNVWNDIVSWQTRRHNNSTKYLLHASMTTKSKKKKQNLLENCQVHALKLF